MKQKIFNWTHISYSDYPFSRDEKRAFSLRAIAIDTFKKAVSTFLYWKKKGILALAIVVVIKIPAFLTTRKNMINEGLGGKGMAISLYLSNYSISTASTNK